MIEGIMSKSDDSLKMTMVPQEMRIDYGKDSLDERQAAQDPMKQFANWFDQARQAGIVETNAMSLATVNASGVPSIRVVLLKEYDARGFVFFTNYESHKGHDLAGNPRASILFYWQSMERQIRVEGTIERIDKAESESYFHSRPREAQIGAWVSRQSTVIRSRAELNERQAELEKRFEGREVPLPEYWGGYRLKPTVFEYWQGRASRLHDRLRYVRTPGGWWRMERLAP